MVLRNSVIASVIMGLSALFMQYVTHVEDIKPNRPFAEFPKKIGKWQGQVERFREEIYQALGVDDSFLANYRNPDGRIVQLYIGFYQSQREGDLIHSPKNCMPGGGWKITQVSKVPIRLNGKRTGTSQIIKLRIENGPNKQVVLYWFHSRGRIISSEYTQKIYLVLDSIFRHRTDGSFIRLISPVSDQMTESQVTEMMQGFAETILPVLDEFIPM